MKREFYRMLKMKQKVWLFDERDEVIANSLLVDKRNDVDIWIGNELVKELLNVLSPKEREVVVRYLFYGETQLAISIEKGVSRVGVNRWYCNAMKKMRKYLVIGGLYREPFHVTI